MLPRSRSTYWGNSRLAKWLQNKVGVVKPVALELHRWKEWNKAYETNHPFVAWLTEDVFDMLQNIVMYPADVVHAARYYIKNRFFDKIHYLPTRLEPGRHYDVDTRLLHGLFETLIDFVEVEKAHMHLWLEEKPQPLRYRFPLLRWTSIRSRELGMKYLAWETTLDKPDLEPEQRCDGQAEVAREIIALYTWWKDVRPLRKDPYDLSGWSEYCATHEFGEHDETALPIVMH